MFDNLRENFELILVVLFLISTVAYIIFRATFARKVKADIAENKTHLDSVSKKERKQVRHNILMSHVNTPFRKLVYFFADLFWVLFFVVIARSFLFEPFIIPSGSMKPGLQIGDIVLVNKFELGLRVPVTNARLTQGKAIERGDVLVFKYPKDTRVSYIKRVIGLPGDRIAYDNRNMTVNGLPVKLDKIQEKTDTEQVSTPQGAIAQESQFTEFNEFLTADTSHVIQYSNQRIAHYSSFEIIVPEGKYFMLGDNRDNSADGREFGYLDDSLVIGRANRIAFNFDCLKGEGKCDRFFKKIQ